VVFTKVTVSLYDPIARLLAVVLIHTITVVVSPDARVPLIDDRVIHAWPFPAVQVIDVPPGFRSV
jgi:hypothetical protein